MVVNSKLAKNIHACCQLHVSLVPHPVVPSGCVCHLPPTPALAASSNPHCQKHLGGEGSSIPIPAPSQRRKKPF